MSINRTLLLFLSALCLTATATAAQPAQAPLSDKPATTAEIREIPLDKVQEIYDHEPPQILSHYTAENPASLHPTLRWDKVLGAVAYEIEIDVPNAAPIHDAHIFVAGYNAALPANTPKGDVTWRVRALNFDNQPITAYSPAETMYVDPAVQTPLYPEPLSHFNTGNGTALLYPVYNWVPVHNAATYDVEILTDANVRPDEPAADSQVMGRGVSHWFDWYDDSPRISTQLLYWRVRALDKNGQPLGVFCPPQPMSINPDKPYTVGTLGDSISHGGGDLSYSPSDWEYSYQYYLDFDTINLSDSGDTSQMTLDRFDRDVLPFHLRYLIIMTGSNSLRGWTSADEVISNLASIEEKCRENGIQPVFLTLPPLNPENIKRAFNEPTAENWRERFQKVNEWIRRQPHIDLATKIPEDHDLPYELGIDGIHLNSRGKQLMAEAINEQWASITGQAQP